MGFLQQFHLVIKYKKGIQNKVADMLSRPPTNASIVIQQIPLVHASYVEQYTCCRYNRYHAILTREPNYTYEDYLARLFVIFKDSIKIFFNFWDSLT